MSYITTGRRRSLKITVVKSEEHPELSGFISTTEVFDGSGAFPGFLALSPTELAQLTSVDFETRRAAYQAHIESTYSYLVGRIDWTLCDLNADVYIKITGVDNILIASLYKDEAYTIPETALQDVHLDFTYFLTEDTLYNGSIIILAGFTTGTLEAMEYPSVTAPTCYKKIYEVVGETHIDMVFNLILTSAPQFVYHGSADLGTATVTEIV